MKVPSVYFLKRLRNIETDQVAFRIHKQKKTAKWLKNKRRIWFGQINSPLDKHLALEEKIFKLRN